MLLHQDPYRTEVVQFLKDRGYSLNKTAEIMGLSQSTVRRILDPHLAQYHAEAQRKSREAAKARSQELEDLPF